MNREREISIIVKSKEGDENAFEILVKNYHTPLFSYLTRLAGNEEAAKDWFQETLIKLWKGIKNYKEENKFSSWLFSIAHNTAMDGIRKKKTRNIFVDKKDLPETKSNEDPMEHVLHNETRRIIEEIINELPQKQKQVFLLRQHGGLSFKEISKLIDEPLNTVLSHMHYAVKKIRKVMKVKYEI